MKLVKESLNFKRESDPYASIGVGTKELIKQWLNNYEIENYRINDDLTIDVNNNVDLDYADLNEFPEYIQFNKVKGSFSCSFNKLTSLRGCPKVVERSFYCHYNNLSSLKYCPKYVEGNFECDYNEKQFNKEEVREYCEVKGNIYV